MYSEKFKENSSDKSAYIFDLFHTLVSLEKSWDGKVAWQIFGSTKEKWDEVFWRDTRDRLIGKVLNPVSIMRQLAHQLDQTINEDLISQATANRLKRFRAALVLVPEESLRVIQALKENGKKLGLISNADVIEAAAWEESPLNQFFDCAFFSCNEGVAKPDPEIYHRCLRCLGTKAEDCFYIGDGGSDELIGAHQVGMSTVLFTGHIKDIYPERLATVRLEADFEIESLGELLV